MPINWPVRKNTSVDGEAARLRVVLWIKLRNFEKMCNQLFSKEKKYLMCKTGHVKRKIELEDTSFFKNRL